MIRNIIKLTLALKNHPSGNGCDNVKKGVKSSRRHFDSDDQQADLYSRALHKYAGRHVKVSRKQVDIGRSFDTCLVARAIPGQSFVLNA
jgi:hypothetical protein